MNTFVDLKIVYTGLNFNPQDYAFMQRCLDLAALAGGMTSPNPMVGCVIVHDNKIIGEGYHHRAGEPHAEVNAIHSVSDKSLLPHSTAYVSLEPCSHHGKTPPCADLLISHWVKKVVCAIVDPNPSVAGKGIEKMRNAGIDVEIGLLEKEAGLLNRQFITYQKEHRPYITLKWAETSDGFVGRIGKDSTLSGKISGAQTDAFVHKLRADHMGIVVGSKTVKTDNPSLTTRNWPGKNPMRIVLGKMDGFPKDLKLLSDETSTIWLEEGIGGFPENINRIAREKECISMLVEGGPKVLSSFLNVKNWDEIYRIVSKEVVWKEGIPAPEISIPGELFMETATDLIYRYQRQSLK